MNVNEVSNQHYVVNNIHSIPSIEKRVYDQKAMVLFQNNYIDCTLRTLTESNN